MIEKTRNYLTENQRKLNTIFIYLNTYFMYYFKFNVFMIAKRFSNELIFNQ